MQIKTYDYKGKEIKFCYNGFYELRKLNGMFISEFVNEESNFDIKGKVVIDIGSYNGDTAIFYILNGAEKVICYEPESIIFQQALMNITLNKMEGKITMINKPAPKLKEIIKLVDGRKKLALKIDCEGCEYNLILGAETKILRRFNSMLVEYHNGNESLSLKIKSAGFKTELIKEEVFNLRKMRYVNRGFIRVSK